MPEKDDEQVDPIKTTSGLEQDDSESPTENIDEKDLLSPMEGFSDFQKNEILSIVKTTRPIPKKMKISAFTFTLLLIGSAIGGGIGVTLGTALANESISAVSNTGVIEVNNPENINWLTAAALKVTPSSVSILSRSAGGFGSGSGIVYNTDGYIVTSAHLFKHSGFNPNVVESEVRFSNGEVVSATLVNLDLTSDLALLKLDSKPLTYNLVPAIWRDSDTVEVGEYVAVIGSPLDMFNSVTQGVISATDRVIQLSLLGGSQGEDRLEFNNGNADAAQGITLKVLQTDAAINPGNSGGGLIDSKGNFIGLNAAISGGDFTRGLGFSIPSNNVTRIIDNMIDKGSSTNALLGASATDQLFNPQSLPSLSKGARLVEIVSNGAAYESGIEKDFVVIKLNGKNINSSADLVGLLRTFDSGTSAIIQGYYTSAPNTILDFNVTLGAAPDGT
jgi:putative serine protease PepD